MVDQPSNGIYNRYEISESNSFLENTIQEVKKKGKLGRAYIIVTPLEKIVKGSVGDNPNNRSYILKDIKPGDTIAIESPLQQVEYYVSDVDKTSSSNGIFIYLSEDKPKLG